MKILPTAPLASRANPAPTSRSLPMPTADGQKRSAACSSILGSGQMTPRANGRRFCGREQKDDLLAGRVPRGNREGLTVQELVNHFLTAKEQQRDAGDISPRSFADYVATGKRVAAAFGIKRLVDDLDATDFQALRARFAKQWGPHRLGGEVQRVRTLFKYGLDVGLYDRPVRIGPTFKRPAARIMRAHRQKSGEKMIEAAELRRIIDTATIPLKAMILLGLNCGYGNSDCGSLPLSAIDLKRGWVDYPGRKQRWSDAARCGRKRLRLYRLRSMNGRSRRTESMGSCCLSRELASRGQKRRLIRRSQRNFASCWIQSTGRRRRKRPRPATKRRPKCIGGELGFIHYGMFSRLSAAVAAIKSLSISSWATLDLAWRRRISERIDDERLQAVVDHVHGWLFAGVKGK